MTDFLTDHSEAVYHVSHEHTADTPVQEHEKCKPVVCRRLYAGSITRYLPEQQEDVMPFYTTDYQMIALTHEHGNFSAGDAVHKNCRPVICRKLYENSTMRYLYGAKDLRIMGDDGLLKAV